jgi:hypothetical protein
LVRFVIDIIDSVTTLFCLMHYADLCPGAPQFEFVMA